LNSEESTTGEACTRNMQFFVTYDAHRYLERHMGAAR